ncbi:glycosyltransferase family 9 protein [Ferrimonas marina]|uniref:ADP-heptose:LPS heptosyltransferase n=1 Tax=Ferrimonas marina TaxID=299255 RepID=A0A1M5ZEV1_9GAMM|nr:glycosyltransferase family 9 protein [Ferrimonas marina]SHI22714.1 ADP-heptose:LPS heptosyltransferase [Ferrimonas marina]
MDRILIIRVDKLGDFCHSLPAFSLLKRSLPDSQIDVIVAPIMEPFAKAMPFIDNVLVYRKEDDNLVETLRERDYQAAIVMHSHKRMAQIVKEAGIPYRLGQRRKWFQYLYTHRAPINRSACLKPEWRYCTDHIEYFLCKNHIPPADIHDRVWQSPDDRGQWQQFYGQAEGERLVFIHPGSGGSEGSLSTQQFAEIADSLVRHTEQRVKFVVTFGPGEESLAQEVVDKIAGLGHTAVKAPPLAAVEEFIRSLAAADMMIAGSTGPLHAASLHNAITVGFYPHKTRDDKIRWQTLSEDVRRLSFSPPQGKETGTQLKLIDAQLVGRKAAQVLHKQFS